MFSYIKTIFKPKNIIPCVRILLYDNEVLNLNSAFDCKFNTDFIPACEMVDKNYKHSELIAMLESGTIPQKQIAALKLDSINNIEEGKLVVSNLIGCDGKIREAVALKINQVLNKSPEVAGILNYPEIFAKASVDINANICRLVIDSVSVLKSNKEFSEKYLEYVLKFIDETFCELDKFIYRDKKYVINKQLFKLYWCLESLKLFVKDIKPNTLEKILNRCIKEKEYTIREKVAQIVILAEDNLFESIKNTLKNDENYYVRNIFK